jgi:5,10-methylene-tetrahydrofolate dehydrogenase/methenyl tetrahydrofolate cyclohydrolase
MSLIDGKIISDDILSKIKLEINRYISIGIPTLAVIQVGDKRESSIYIKKKCEACKNVGIESIVHNLDTNIVDNDICELIEKLNNYKGINGILVQLPMPEHLNEELILQKINYTKDIDGFHPQNIGNLAINNRTPNFISCTALGCIELLLHENVKLEGRHAVIIGKSNIVGLPLSLLLMKANATVTVCHDKTENIKEHTNKADILISACGQPEMIKSDWIKKDVVIIDVGINPKEDKGKKSGYRLVGDVDYNDVKDKVSKITPVPGGVGPMTVAILLSNTLKAFKQQNNIHVDFVID